MHKRILISYILVIFCGCGSLKENKTPEFAGDHDNYNTVKAYCSNHIQQIWRPYSYLHRRCRSFEEHPVQRVRFARQQIQVLL